MSTTSPPARAISRRTLADAVADRIVAFIHAERLGAGDPVPPISTLAIQLNVSRTIVRDAVDQLAARGVLRQSEGRRWLVDRAPRRSSKARATSDDDLAHRSLADQATDAVLDMILRDGYEEGDPLPAGKDLAERLGVSIVVIREALASLAARGILTRRRGRESSVTAPEFHILSSILQVRAKLNHISLEEFQDCREALEAEAARLAARRNDVDKAEVLGEHVARMRAADSPDELIVHDLAFHLEIADLSGNRAIDLILHTLNDVIRSQMFSSHEAVKRRAGQHGIDRSLDIHEDLFHAIVAGDEERSVAAVRDHFGLLAKL